MTTRVPHDVQLACPAGCGYRTPVTTARLAKRGVELHSCARHRAIAETRARGEAFRTSIDRTPKPCLHPKANHQHGHYVTYVADACRCRPCVDAAVAYERTRKRQTAYGRWSPFQDAEPVRAHVRSLMAQGMGLKRIMAKGGISGGTMVKLLYGVEGRPPSRKIRNETAARILAVELDLAGGILVDAEPTWRLIHGLIALGYTKTWIAHQLGQQGSGLQLRRTMVSKRHADAIRALADRYAATPGPSERSRRMAAANGWTPELLWTDVDDDAPAGEDVDDVAVQRACAGEPVTLNRAERLEAVRRLRVTHRRGYKEIAALLHLDQRQVHRALTTLGLIGAEGAA